MQTEIPRTVIEHQFNTGARTCRGCGSYTQGGHEPQTSDAVRAAAVQPELNAKLR